MRDGEQTEEEATVKKNHGLHLYPHPVYTAALNRLCKKLRDAHPDFQNKKRVSQSRAFEFIMEQVLGESDEELKRYIELRNEQRSLYHETAEQVKGFKRNVSKPERRDDDE